MGDGSFVDPDPVDTEAFHIIARSQGRAVGCARIVPPINLQSGFIASTIGTRRFEAILRDLGSDPERSCEASRWVVVPECRGRLGRQIVAGSWAVARWLSLEMAFVLACTCERQDLALIEMGARAISGLPLFRSRISEDNFRLLYFDTSDASKSMEKQIAQITRAIRLNQIIASSRPVGPNAAAYVVI